MATSTDDIVKNYPLPVYNYRVNIGQDTVAFTEVSGLDISYDNITYKESQVEKKQGPRILYMPGQPQPVNISLKKGWVKENSMKALYAWFSEIKLNRIEKKDISIDLCDEAGEAVITWKVLNAFPSKLSAPSFSASSNDIAIEGMDLMADWITVTEN
jgi:phage tail-like protein